MRRWKWKNKPDWKTELDSLPEVLTTKVIPLGESPEEQRLYSALKDIITKEKTKPNEDQFNGALEGNC